MSQLTQLLKTWQNHHCCGRLISATAVLSMLAIGGSIGSRAAIADDVGYWASSSDKVWRSGFGHCWRSGHWTAGMATEACDPDLMAQAEPAAEPEAAEPRQLDSDGDGVADYQDRCANTPLNTDVDEYGCLLAGTKIFTIEGVYFAFDRSELRPEARSILDEAVRALRDNRSVTVAISGHTDSTGSDTYNQGLSKRRAQSVNDYMVAHGIDTNRLRVYGRGEDEPITTNQTREGRAENRRVEFVVVQ